MLLSEATYSSTARLLSYLLPSMLASVLLNLPKFLEARLENFTYVHNNITATNLVINVTSLRVDPNYSYYYIGWTRYLLVNISIDFMNYELLLIVWIGLCVCLLNI